MKNVVEFERGEFVDPLLVPLRTAGMDTAALLRQAGRQKPRTAVHDLLEQALELPKLWSRMRSVPAQVRAASEGLKCIRENKRGLKAALEDTGEAVKGLSHLPMVRTSQEARKLRAIIVAESLLQASEYLFDERRATAFVEGFQEFHQLEMNELWALKPLLQLVLLVRIGEAARSVLHNPQKPHPELLETIQSLRQVRETDWRDYFENVSAPDQVLRQDPSGVYRRMESDSRDQYRGAVADLARHSEASESSVAEAALSLAREAGDRQFSDARFKERLIHVGYYLVDDGRALLEKRIEYHAPPTERLRRLLKTYPNGFYLIGIELATFLILLFVLGALSSRAPILAGFLLLLIPATQSAVQLMNHLVTFLLPAGRLPKLDLSSGIPDEYSTIVAVPVLLLDEPQVRRLVQDLEVRYLANHDPNLHFVLLSDSPDSAQPFDDKDQLVALCRQLVEELNQKYSAQNRGGFLLLHRHPVYYESEDAWLGWERKRGKLLELNKLMRGGEDCFPIKVGDVSVLFRARYVITLDADTQLPRGTAHRLIGAIAHPLNRALIDPVRNIVVKGYGILQPRVGVSIQSASRSRLANIYSGQTGFDIYTRAVSDVYQDLYGEGIFTGKGIYEVDTLHVVLERRFPRSALLSHDLIEGAYARAGLVSDIELIDDYPTHFSAHSRRKHRWVRGDWQTLTWLFELVPDESGRRVLNPISVVSRWKIVDNLRRSLVEPAAFALLLTGWFGLPGGSPYWTRISLSLMFLPLTLEIAFTLARFLHRPTDRAFREMAGYALTGIVAVLLNLVFLAHQTLVDLDAIVRSNVRRAFTRKRMLQWETAAEAEMDGRRRGPVDFYLKCMPFLAAVIFILLAFLNRPALDVAWPFLSVWASSGMITQWLNRRPRERRSELTAADGQLLRLAALRTWRYFRYFSDARSNWLIPDNVQETPPRIAFRASPTNLGMLLNARLSACDLGFCTLSEFAAHTRETLRSMERLPRSHGHFYNWYDTETLRPISPFFISTVDSGNLAGSLWSLKQACLEMQHATLLQPSVLQSIRDHLFILEELSADFAQLRARANALGDDLGAWLKESQNLLAELSERSCNACEEVAWWARETASRLEGLLASTSSFAPWLSPEYETLLPRIAGVLPETPVELKLDSLPECLDKIKEALRAEPENALAQSLAAELKSAANNAVALSEQLADIAAIACRFVCDMDFAMLYNPTRKLLSIGYDATEEKLHSAMYDLLASEARLAYFVAVAKGDVPQESWFRLDRVQTLYQRERLLLSWTGTMFEYLMPALWMRSYANTLLDRSLRAVLRCQQKYARSRNIPWGISESAYAYRDENGNYQYQAFGVPALALHEHASRAIVVSPYSTFLALAVDPSAAVANIRKMDSMNWVGPFGYYESADYTVRAVAGRTGEHELVRCWMVHHQGMILVSIGNLLCDSATQRRFHSHPRVLATELILHEKALPSKVIDAASEAEQDWPMLEAPLSAFGGA
jgi:cyclic beta-1,2-glucan glucanotransferase